ncbi:MAG TPA: hypothetical protein VFF33_12760, partial [Ignavibacteriaceae bacterium]|nr:hypothetical protein [Ignavibacteriaceae bacterium]
MKKFVQILFLIFIINFTGSAQWRKVLEAPYLKLTEFSYINKNLIFISGNDGKILKTTDNCNSFNDLHTGTPSNLVGIKAFNEDLIYALSQSNVFIKTTDGGNSFLLDSLEEGIGDAMSMYFLDQNVGYVLTNGSGSSKLLKTSDAGTNWRVVLNIPSVLKSMYFNDATHGCVAGGGAGVLNLYYTKDGENFIKGVNPSFGQYQYTKFIIETIHMCDSNIVYASGWGSTYLGLQPTIFLKSTNGGETWVYQEQLIENRTYETVYGLAFKDANNGIAIGGGSRGARILKTSDGGLNWLPQYKPLGCILRNIFSKNDTLWILGDGAFIAISNDFFNNYQIKSSLHSTGLYSIKWVTE